MKNTGERPPRRPTAGQIFIMNALQKATGNLGVRGGRAKENYFPLA